MPDSLKRRALDILANSVSDVVGAGHLAYVAIKKLARDDDNEAKHRWASNTFEQISVGDRREIRSVAINKAHEERRQNLAAVKQRERAKDIQVADLGRIFRHAGE